MITKSKNQMSKNKKESGQSLIELLVAMSIFIMVVSVVTFLILDVYLSDRVGREQTIATFLAQEGMEAARSIRDNNWGNLTNGEYGLSLLAGKWVFAGNEEDIGDYLGEGKRKIIIEEINSNRKKITSEVIWKLTEARSGQVSLVSYLTNWSKSIPVEACSPYCQSIDYSDGLCRQNVNQCILNGEVYESDGDAFCVGGPEEDTCCCLP